DYNSPLFVNVEWFVTIADFRRTTGGTMAVMCFRHMPVFTDSTCNQFHSHSANLLIALCDTQIISDLSIPQLIRANITRTTITSDTITPYTNLERDCFAIPTGNIERSR